MGDENQRDVFLGTSLSNQIDDLPLIPRIDVGRRLIRQNEIRLIGQRAGNRDTLLFADRHRPRLVVQAMAQSHAFQQTAGTHVLVGTQGRSGRALLSVADDGSGVPVEHAERIFDRFYRVEGAQASGSGLGLAIARELAARMGGTVELSLEDGRTTFTLALPAVAAAPEALPAAS